MANCCFVSGLPLTDKLIKHIKLVKRPSCNYQITIMHHTILITHSSPCDFRPYLTNPDVSERCKGTQLLALLLHRLMSFKLLDKEGKIKNNCADWYHCTLSICIFLSYYLSYYILIFLVTTLAEFFCDRLKDHFSVIPHVISGLLALVGSDMV